MTLHLESSRDQAAPVPSGDPARSGTPFWRRPWVGPLAVLVVLYLYTASAPFLGVPEDKAPLQPHDNFPLYYPVLIVHMIAGTIAMLAVVPQVWPWLRERHPKVHRTFGRVYLLGTAVAVATGLVVVWWAPKSGKTGALCLLLVWGATSAIGYHAARRRNFAKHRQFMLYSFAIAMNNIWASFALIVLVALQIPIDPVYQPEASRWIPWVGNLMLVQWWLYRTARQAGVAGTATT